MRSVDSDASMQRKHLPMVDFAGVDPRTPASWCSAREQVMRAFGLHGGFEAVYDRVTHEHRRSLLELAEDLFSLPLATKLKNASDEPFAGYLGQFPGLAFESLAIAGATLPHSVPAFAALMWPDGNPRFCEKVKLCTEKMAELVEVVRRMVLESLGVAEYCEEQARATYHLLRLTEYGEAGKWAEDKRDLSHMGHRDTNWLTAVWQLNDVCGLQVEAKNGEWAVASPRSPASFFVIAGEALEAWSNGKVYAPLHGVKVEETGGGKGRYCMILFARPTSERPIEAPAELVDEFHPSLYRSFYYDDFLRFCASAESRRIPRKRKLAAYAGAIAPPPETATKEAESEQN